MKKACQNCSKEFEIFTEDLEFIDKVSPSFNGNKCGFLPPTQCPECRDQRRLAIHNIIKLYKSTCKHTGKQIISPFSKDKDYNVVTRSCWYSDEIDGRDYGREFDFTRGFFEQFSDLQKVAPRWDRITIDCENCDWSLNILNSKNCYLTRSTIESEDCLYSYRLFSCNNVVDCSFLDNSQNCYKVFDGENCNTVFYGEMIKNCSNSIYLYDCEQCTDCIGCAGLRHKKHYILNKQYTKQEFEFQKAKLLSDINYREDFLKKFANIKSVSPRRAQLMVNTENCSGDNIKNSKNVLDSFSVKDSQDCRYIENGTNTKDSYDCSMPDFQECTYELSSTYNVYNSAFCFNSADLYDCYYSETCINLKNCFGCSGLKNSQYCILNKQYTKEEYEKLVPKIIEHMKKMSYPSTGSGGSCGSEWGEFFPVSKSIFCYNESLSQDFYPINEDIALNKGWKWCTHSEDIPENTRIIPANKLPDNIKDIPDDILNWAIECEKTGKPFKIVAKELEFYRKNQLPIPHIHPDIRHEKRNKLRRPKKLWKDSCKKCTKDIETSYDPGKKLMVCCYDCYIDTVY